MIHSCRCPLYATGYVDGKRVRISLDTANYERAAQMIREMDAAPEQLTAREEKKAKRNAVTFAAFKTEFLADADARLATETRRKFRLLLDELETYGRTSESGIAALDEFTPRVLLRFRDSWRNQKDPEKALGAGTATKKLERLKAVFKFAVNNKYLETNPASSLRSPSKARRQRGQRSQNTEVTTKSVPFDAPEWARILGALETFIVKNMAGARHVAAIRLRALVLLMRYSGLRITDAICCPASAIVGGKLYLGTGKTGTEVFIPLPHFLVKMLDDCPHKSPGYFFWTGTEKPTTARGDWSKSLQRLFKAANIKGGHSHRFRHTFAASLLVQGVPIEEVAAFLGHENVKVTQKHYAKWIKARQERAEERIRAVLANDPTVLLYGSEPGTLPRN